MQNYCSRNIAQNCNILPETIFRPPSDEHARFIFLHDTHFTYYVQLKQQITNCYKTKNRLIADAVLYTPSRSYDSFEENPLSPQSYYTNNNFNYNWVINVIGYEIMFVLVRCNLHRLLHIIFGPLSFIADINFSVCTRVWFPFN